jgi:O-antigen/teichoic acid export membrane protein
MSAPPPISPPTRTSPGRPIRTDRQSRPAEPTPHAAPPFPTPAATKHPTEMASDPRTADRIRPVNEPESTGADRFLRHSGKFLVGTVLRVLAQGALFVLLARTMPINEYGVLAAVTAFVAIVSPFASLGGPSLLMQNHADEPGELARHLSRGLVLCAVGGTAASVFVAITGGAIWNGLDWWILLWLALADLVAWRLIEVVAAAAQVQGRVLLAAAIPAMLHIARLAVAVALVWSDPVLALGRWAMASVAISGLFCLIVLVAAVRDVGYHKPALGPSLSQLRLGSLFAVGLSAQTIYNDIDKVMLSQLNTAESVAIYAAAYRVVDFAHVPTRAMAATAYPRFFRAGRDGLGAVTRLAKHLAPKYLVYGFSAAALLAAGSGLMPVIFGPEYGAAEFALRGLSILVALKAIHYLAADALSGARRQGVRTAIQLIVALFNIGLNYVLIPDHGWRGAVIASIVCDAVLAVSLWSTLLILRRGTTPTGLEGGASCEPPSTSS